MTLSPKSKLNALKRIITSSSPSDPAPPAPPADDSPTSPATTARTTRSWPEHDEVGESSRMAEERGGGSNPSSTDAAGPSPRRSRFYEDNGAVGVAAARRGSAFTEGENTLVGEETDERVTGRGGGGGGGGEEREQVENWRVGIVCAARGGERREDEERRWEEERRRELEMQWEDEKGPGLVEDVVAVLRKMVHKKDRKGKGTAVCKCCPQRKRSYRKFMETPEAWWKATRP